MKKENIVNGCIYVVAIILAILTLIFQKNMSYILIIYGIGATIIGLLSIIIQKKYGILLIGLGANIVITYFLYIKEILTLPKCITFMICSSLSSIILITIIMGFIIRAMMKKKYIMEIDATVVDLIKEPNTKREYYKPLYAYKFKNTDYEIEALDYVKYFIPKIGSKVRINIKPDEPTEVYFFPSRYRIIIDVIGALLFISVCVYIIIKLFRGI